MMMKPSNGRITTSREASYFIGTRNNSNGVVVESLWNKCDPVTHTVIDFTTKKSVYALRTCFKSREDPKTRSQFYKDERPYEVFDNVNYVADEKGYVHEVVARNQKKWECFNMGNDVFAVKSFCVFSEDEPALCFTDVVGEVRCDPSVYSKVLCKNVTFDCYVQFKFTRAIDFDGKGSSDVEFELFKVDGVNPEKFDFALNAPWLSHAKRHMYDSFDPFVADHDPLKEKNISGLTGYMLTGKTFYIPSRPQMQVALASNQMGSLLNADNIKVVPNMALCVDVRYNYILDRFIIFEASKRDSTALTTEVIDNNFLRGSICTIGECSGFFLLNSECLVFDKYGLLSELYGKIETRMASFGYMDPDDRAYTTLVVSNADVNAWLNIKNMTFEGLCINKNEFYCHQLHHYLLFATNGNFAIGKWYSIKVVKVDYANYTAEVKPTSFTKDSVQVKKVHDGFEFLVRYVWLRMGNFYFLLGENIGPIGFLDDQVTKPRTSDRNIYKCIVQFGKPIEDHLKRPQVRPKFIKDF